MEVCAVGAQYFLNKVNLKGVFQRTVNSGWYKGSCRGEVRWEAGGGPVDSWELELILWQRNASLKWGNHGLSCSFYVIDWVLVNRIHWRGR